MEQWWNDFGKGKPKDLEKNLSSCQYLIILLMYVESQVCLA
jgi:hypothetical protein